MTLYKPGFAGKANITALVVDSAPSVCSMPGAACFAKRLQKIGVQLADSRLIHAKTDVLTSDLLVGMDYFWACVNKSKLPEQKLGMYLLRSLWGNCLAGKIPGSVKKFTPTAVSTLTIANVNSHSLVVPQVKVVSSSSVKDLNNLAKIL